MKDSHNDNLKLLKQALDVLRGCTSSGCHLRPERRSGHMIPCQCHRRAQKVLAMSRGEYEEEPFEAPIIGGER